jgi:hypothetical protein
MLTNGKMPSRSVPMRCVKRQVLCVWSLALVLQCRNCLLPSRNG